MRNFMLIAVLSVVASVNALAWNCPTGQIRQQAPTGTPTTTPYYDVVEGIAFICVPTTPTTPASNGTTVANTNTNNLTNNSSANSNSSSSSSSNASSNQTQGQGQKQTQSNSSTNNNKSQGGSVSDVGNSNTVVEAPQIPVNTAVAPPVFSTTNCFKGWSAGGQTPLVGGSFGGGGIDKNCAAERIAQDFYAMGNRLAACKVITTTKASKAAGVTMDDCMNVPAPRPVVVAPVVPAPAPVVVNVPQPEVVYIEIPHETMTVVAPKTAPKRPVVHRAVPKPCIVPKSLTQPMGEK
jgi:hypothetical protein